MHVQSLLIITTYSSSQSCKGGGGCLKDRATVCRVRSSARYGRAIAMDALEGEERDLILNQSRDGELV